MIGVPLCHILHQPGGWHSSVKLAPGISHESPIYPPQGGRIGLERVSATFSPAHDA
jgi:hypothetical protein